MASDWFWETDELHKFCYFSRRMEDVTRFDITKLIGRDRTVIPSENLKDPKWIKHFDDLQNHRPFRNFEYEMRRPHDGSLLWIRIAGEPQFDTDGTFTGYRGTGQDITDEKLAMQRLKASNAELAERNRDLDQARKTIERSAYEDDLTMLGNRRAFERDLEEAFDGSDLTLGLLHLDLDRFKWVNDTLGHPAGDEVLKVAAQRFRDCIAGNGKVYRVGGDEFMVVLPNCQNPTLTTWLGDSLSAAMEPPISLGAQRVKVGVCVGIATANGSNFDMRRLIAHADAALYEAKRNGRNRVCFSTPELQARVEDQLLLISDIPRAIENRELVPFFQPQFDAITGMLVGAEALVRWRHPERGLLTPDAFLQTATELGVVDQIDRLMLETSLAAAGRFAKSGHALPALSVNLSAARLADPTLCDEIERYWTDKSCRLAVELLETIYFDDSHQSDQFGQNLERLREIGVCIDTDDFGSGRASITGLLKIAPDRIKIDRHLVQKVVSSDKQRSLVLAIIEMAHALDIECIAEGVETHADIDALTELGCRIFQGYVFSRPLGEEDFGRYLASQKIAPLEIQVLKTA